jgi:hypothetical protein
MKIPERMTCRNCPHFFTERSTSAFKHTYARCRKKLERGRPKVMYVLGPDWCPLTEEEQRGEATR